MELLEQYAGFRSRIFRSIVQGEQRPRHVMAGRKNNESKLIVLFVTLFHRSGIGSSTNHPLSPIFFSLQLFPLTFSPSKMSNTESSRPESQTS